MRTLHPRMERVDVAIVGAGASGALVAAWLLRNAHGPFRVALVDRTGRFGTGLAYGTRDPAHLLNVPAGKMSADPERPGHLVEWARRRGHDVDAGTYVPRALYGDYLQDFLATAEVIARDGVELLRVPREVVRVREGVLELDTGATLAADRIVLASGNLPPSPLRVPGMEAVLGSPAYIPDPWSSRLRALPADASVLILGTGLTAVDVALTLRRRSHHGSMVMLSRRGLLPRPHTEAEVTPLPVMASGSPRAVLRTLRRAATKAEVEGATWRSVVDGLRARTPAIWSRWSPAERAAFDRHLRAYWDAHRHRMPPEVTAQIDYLRAAGRLEVLAGRVESLAVLGDAVRVTLRHRWSGEREVHLFDAVVNCMGPMVGSDAAPLSALVDEGIARADRFGLVTHEGRVTPWLFAVGPLRRSELWETTAMPEIRVQARQLAEELLRDQQDVAAAQERSVN